MVLNQPLPQQQNRPRKTNAKAVTPAMPEVTNVAKAAMVNAVKAVAKDAMVSAAKAATVAVVVTAVASVRVSVRVSVLVSVRAIATSAQKAHRQKHVKLASRVNPAPRAKAAATIAKVSVRLNGSVTALSARRVNAVKP